MIAEDHRGEVAADMPDPAQQNQQLCCEPTESRGGEAMEMEMGRAACAQAGTMRPCV